MFLFKVLVNPLKLQTLAETELAIINSTLLSACSERAFCAFKLQELGTRVSFSVQMYPYGIHIHRRS